MDKQTQQRLNKALRILREVEVRAWHDILLSSPDFVNESVVIRKLLATAAAYTAFRNRYPEAVLKHRAEAYAILKAAFNGLHFPERQCLSREQFGYLLDLHLDLL